MKKHLYKIFATLALLFAVAATQAQYITVTFAVDMTPVADSIGPGGVRIAGYFVTNRYNDLIGSTVITSNWDITNAGGKLTNAGNNIWVSQPITMLLSAAGDSVEFKFIRDSIWNDAVGNHNDEGHSNTTHLDATCGYGDGYGGFNRQIIVPTVNSVFTAEFNHCGTLSPTGIHELHNGVASLDVYPNPAPNFTQITYGLAGNDNVTITLRSFTGQVLRTLVNQVQSPGLYTYDLRTDDLAEGMYFVQINARGTTFYKRFVVSR